MLLKCCTTLRVMASELFSVYFFYHVTMTFHNDKLIVEKKLKDKYGICLVGTPRHLLARSLSYECRTLGSKCDKLFMTHFDFSPHGY